MEASANRLTRWYALAHEVFIDKASLLSGMACLKLSFNTQAADRYEHLARMLNSFESAFYSMAR